jgi:TLC domain
LNFYGCTFILYELSSPFLNFHWFFDKLDMTGSLPQLYNGIVLLFTFFGCRLCWGTYQSIRVYQDVWDSIHHKPAATGRSALPLNDGIMRFAGQEYVPIWLALTYLGSNIVLNTLNFYWFGKMIETLRKRFPSKDEKEKPVAVKDKEPNGAVKVSVNQTEVRRRQVVHVDEDKEDADYESVTLS